MPPAAATTPVLIVEDDAELRVLYRTALSMAGYTVKAVEDGMAALRVIETDRPVGIVLDLGLPRLHGRDVQREIAAHAETRDIPIVVITGLADHDLNAGEVACILRKPIEPEDLVAAARRCFPPPRGFSVFG